MKTTRARRGILALAAAALVAAAGGIAYASIPDADGTYHACMLKHVGTIRIIDPDRQRCSTHLEVEIAFGKEGPQGDPGPPGPPGPPGADGEDGEDFSGTFTSPNGEYSLSVTDAGIVLSGPSAVLTLDGDGVAVNSAADVIVSANGSFELEADGTARLRAGATLSLFGAFVRLNDLGGACTGAARRGDLVQGSATPAGLVTASIITAAPTVCVGG